MNITQLAKECGAEEEGYYRSIDDSSQYKYIFYTAAELTAFANAIVEECAKVAEQDWKIDISNEIRALKVKG